MITFITQPTTDEALEATATDSLSPWAQVTTANLNQMSWTSKQICCRSSAFLIQKEAKKEQIEINR